MNAPKGQQGQPKNGQPQNGQAKGTQPKSSQPGGDAGTGRKRRNRKRRNKSNAKALTEYWGEVDALPAPRDDIRITTDPAAVVRSLGRPPLPGQEQVSEAYFTAVYTRAVALASALAAAGELIEPEELLDD